MELKAPVQLTPEQEKLRFERLVMEAQDGKCSNCGSTSKVSVHMVVPLESGGKYVDGNGVVLCRACDMAAKAAQNASQAAAKRPVNFLMSRAMHGRLTEGLAQHMGFSSMGSLVRHLMNMYSDSPDRFDDLNLYQDDGSDVKVNVWVDNDTYKSFKEAVASKDLTVTDAIKGLLLMYEMQAQPLLGVRS